MSAFKLCTNPVHATLVDTSNRYLINVIKPHSITKTNLLSARETHARPDWSTPPQTSNFPAALGAGHGH